MSARGALMRKPIENKRINTAAIIPAFLKCQVFMILSPFFSNNDTKTRLFKKESIIRELLLMVKP